MFRLHLRSIQHSASHPEVHKQKIKNPNNLAAVGVNVLNKKLGSDLLFHTLVYSTIGDEGLDF